MNTIIYFVDPEMVRGFFLDEAAHCDEDMSALRLSLLIRAALIDAYPEWAVTVTTSRPDGWRYDDTLSVKRHPLDDEDEPPPSFRRTTDPDEELARHVERIVDAIMVDRTDEWLTCESP